MVQRRQYVILPKEIGLSLHSVRVSIWASLLNRQMNSQGGKVGVRLALDY